MRGRAGQACGHRERTEIPAREAHAQASDMSAQLFGTRDGLAGIHHDWLGRRRPDRRRDGDGLLHDQVGAPVVTRGLAQELGSKDITANLVQPGSTDTYMNPADGEYADFQRSLTPLGRYATPADIVAAVAFLASPAARHITGTIFTVDGGMLT